MRARCSGRRCTPDVGQASGTARDGGPGTREHLVAASLMLRGRATSEEARELMAERRAEAFQRGTKFPEMCSLITSASRVRGANPGPH
ncbi:MAG TPA: hypothetical protein VN880_03010 [Solirubrobacteraceae bacterium]|nr:hypothetical protein [Solirubrobacteraceae bacterium]